MKPEIFILLGLHADAQILEALLHLLHQVVSIFALGRFGLEVSPKFSNLIEGWQGFNVGLEAVDTLEGLAMVLLKGPVGRLAAGYLLGKREGLRFNLPITRGNLMYMQLLTLI